MLPSRRNKVFCIGLNKTGTTSLEQALRDWGYKMGNQANAEHLIKDYSNRSFKSIAKYCKNAEAFQDVPFSMPYLFIYLDQYFPNSKFILTVRDTPNQWYESMTKFHSKLFGNGSLPTQENLQNSSYRYKGYMLDWYEALPKVKDHKLMYPKEIMLEIYNDHLTLAKNYFRGSNRFISINVAKESDYFRLAQFLKKKTIYSGFPWENKTKS